MTIDWNNYQPGNFYDETISSPGNARLPARRLVSYLKSLDEGELVERRDTADVTIKKMGITFTV